ncbi:MAG: glycosyltransferase [Gemmatimonadota bacterium]|nr:hypothetical protein [Gemmatimonadota bacterium]MDP6801883.1 glycosyltransferase [Gemmatimonadota bacterium]
MIRGRDFVVLADDWGRHPSSCQHLFQRLAPENRVLWVNTIGTRASSFSASDFARVRDKFRGWMGRAPGEVAGEIVEVWNPVMTPFDQWRPFRSLNGHLLRRSVRKAIDAYGMRNPFLVTTIPNAFSLVGEVGECASVYYCVDEFSEWPGASRGAMREMEAELLRKVDLVVATSQELFDAKSLLHSRVRLLRHGVDWRTFAEGNRGESSHLQEIPQPRVGLTGLVDLRLDVRLVGEIAREMPEVAFVFVGPRQLPRCELDAIPNVYFRDAVPYAEVPGVLSALDAAFLPYVESTLTDCINPLKLREFLAAGLPVVATPLPEVVVLREHLYPAGGPMAWKDALRAALSEDPVKRAARSCAMKSEGWEARTEEFSRALGEAEEVAGAGL